MNSKQINLSNNVIAAYCKREHEMQQRVYPRMIQEGKMTKEQANTNWLIIQKMGEMVQLLEEREMQWKELEELILLGVKVLRPKAEQQRLF